MAKKIYKYVGPDPVEKVLASTEGVSLRCSRPEDFNDPYELFLTVDVGDDPDLLAYYEEVIGDIPQLPTTCFSRSPTVIPMWAHYAQELEGFVIELEEECLTKSFPRSSFGDVDYRDSPDDNLLEALLKAYTTLKNRHVYLVQRGVGSAAYFTKATTWSYEQERRMIVHDDETRMLGELIIVDVPPDCVSALISGPRASPETLDAVRAAAARFGCSYFDARIGRSSTLPFFVNADGETCVFDGTSIEPAAHSCECGEPLSVESDQCSWCKICDSHREQATARNP